MVLDAGTTSFAGTRRLPVPFANNPSLIGAQLYSQYLVNEPAANAWGWTITSAIRAPAFSFF